MALASNLFVSHGAPTLAIQDGPAHRFLKGLGATLPQPRAILVLSAHWETGRPHVMATPAPETIHDFRGFPDALYRITYPAPGDPALAENVAALLREAGLDPVLDRQRGFDHGAWVPLHLIYPQADLPVLQLSINPHGSPTDHHHLGAALAPLRRDGVMLLATGSFTHNLGAFRGQPVDAETPAWVRLFAEWMAERVEAGDTDALLDYRRRAPHAVDNHPTDEHLLPFFVTLGAAAPGERIDRLHASFTHGILAMDAYGSA